MRIRRPRFVYDRNDPVYRFIVDYRKEHGRSPKLAEIREACALHDVSYRINHLVQAGLLRRTPWAKRGIEVVE